MQQAVISAAVVCCKHVAASEIQSCLLGTSRFEVRERTRFAKQLALTLCPAASWIIFFPPGLSLFLFFFLLCNYIVPEQVLATPSPTLPASPSKNAFSNNTATTQQLRLLRHHGLLWSLLRCQRLRPQPLQEGAGRGAQEVQLR
jgi:hypothetical protein